MIPLCTRITALLRHQRSAVFLPRLLQVTRRSPLLVPQSIVHGRRALLFDRPPKAWLLKEVRVVVVAMNALRNAQHIIQLVPERTLAAADQVLRIFRILLMHVLF